MRLFGDLSERNKKERYKAIGYTHYFPQLRPLTDEEWNGITADIKALCAASPVTLCNGSGDIGSDPEFLVGAIAFNGEDNMNDDAHETFWLPKSDTDFNFCKTARKPYDLIVTAALCAVNHRAPHAFRIGSDGDIEDWQDGLEFAQKTLNDPSLTMPLTHPLEDEAL